MFVLSLLLELSATTQEPLPVSHDAVRPGPGIAPGPPWGLSEPWLINAWLLVCPVFPPRCLVQGLSHNRCLWKERKFMTSCHLKVKSDFSMACGAQHVSDPPVSPAAAAAPPPAF